MREFCPTCCQVIPPTDHRALPLTARVLAEISESAAPILPAAIHRHLAAKGVDTTRDRVEKSCRRMRDQGRIRKATRYDPTTRAAVTGWESALKPADPETLETRQNPLGSQVAEVQPSDSDSSRMIELVLDLQDKEMEGIDPLQVQRGWANRYRDQRDVPTPDPGRFQEMLDEIERAQQE